MEHRADAGLGLLPSTRGPQAPWGCQRTKGHLPRVTKAFPELPPPTAHKDELLQRTTD